jgi:hypothetical protein
VEALQTTNLDKIHKDFKKNLETIEIELNGLYSRRSELTTLLATGESYLQAMQRGDWGDPQAHVTIKRYPEPPLGKIGRFATYWAAISGALLLLSFAALLLFLPSGLLFWAVIVAGIFLAVESAIWGRFAEFLMFAVILLTFINCLVLIWNFWWQIIVLIMMGIVVLSMIKNLKELRLG